MCDVLLKTGSTLVTEYRSNGVSMISPAWLAGPGEMRERVRLLDWAATPLGEFAEWPEELRTAVGVCLGLGTPACIFWDVACIQIYNDAYTQILRRKHPESLGCSVY